MFELAEAFGEAFMDGGYTRGGEPFFYGCEGLEARGRGGIGLEVPAGEEEFVAHGEELGGGAECVGLEGAGEEGIGVSGEEGGEDLAILFLAEVVLLFGVLESELLFGPSEEGLGPEGMFDVFDEFGVC